MALLKEGLFILLSPYYLTPFLVTGLFVYGI